MAEKKQPCIKMSIQNRIDFLKEFNIGALIGFNIRNKTRLPIRFGNS
jgi:hypothetical protein